MITVATRKWRATMHHEEHDYMVLLNGVILATYSTYGATGTDPQLEASAFAKKLLEAMKPTLEAVQDVLSYRECSAHYNKAAAALLNSIEQLKHELGG